MIEAGLTIKIVFDDKDDVEINIRAGNSGFSGIAHLYSSLEELSAFCDHIAGFPRTSGRNENMSLVTALFESRTR